MKRKTEPHSQTSLPGDVFLGPDEPEETQRKVLPAPQLESSQSHNQTSNNELSSASNSPKSSEEKLSGLLHVIECLIKVVWHTEVLTSATGNGAIWSGNSGS